MTTERQAARALLVTPDREVLLMLFRVPSQQRVWIAPGGGVAPGEQLQDAAAREVLEETGLRVQLSGPVWTRTHSYWLDAGQVRQTETFFFARVPRFEPTSAQLEALERRSFLEFRWWELAALRSSSERFAPRGLGEHLARLLELGPPGEPIDVGV